MDKWKELQVLEGMERGNGLLEGTSTTIEEG
jgi:hypothetical protein